MKTTFTASGAIGKFTLVSADGSGKVVQATAGVSCVGANSFPVKRADGEEFAVASGERMEVTAGGAIFKGDHVSSDASGHAVKSSGTNKIIGQAMTTVATTGAIVEIVTYNLS